MQPQKIDSHQNPRIKAVRALRERKGRREGTTVIDGAREIRRAVAAGVPIVELFISPDELAHPSSEDAAAVLASLSASECKLWEVSDRGYQKLSYGDRKRGMTAVAEFSSASLDSLQFRSPALVAVLAGVEKPGNLGAVIRTADAVGCDAVIAAGAGADPGNPNCIRASQGLVFAMPTVVAEEEKVFEWLRSRNLQIAAAWVDAERDYTEVDLSLPTAIVLGAEDRGLAELWRDPSVIPFALPMRGVGDSLNVSVAAAVVLYEARRQRDLRAGAPIAGAAPESLR